MIQFRSFHLWCTVLASAIFAAAQGGCSSAPTNAGTHKSGANGADASAPPASHPKPTPNMNDGGTGDPNGGGNNGDDAGSISTGDDAGSGNDATSAAPACIAPGSSPDDGHHNAGRDCLNCHADISSAQWTIAGTLYESAGGGSPVSGATIEIIDANGQTLDLVSCDNGNFYTDQNVAFPIKVRASSCPSNSAMQSSPDQGSCNASGCHASGNRIHL